MLERIFVKKNNLPSKGDTLLFFYSDQETSVRYLENFFTKELCQKIKTKMKLFHFSGKKEQLLSFEAEPFYNNVIFIGVGNKNSFQEIDCKNSIANALRKARECKASSVYLWFDEILFPQIKNIGKCVSIAFFLSRYIYHIHKKEETREKHHNISSFTLFTNSKSIDEIKQSMHDGNKIADAIIYTRHLVNEPASHIYPSVLAQKAIEIASKSTSISVSILDRKECEKLGMGAFTAVAKGSEHEAKFIILKYSPSASTHASTDKTKTICLIGKSITFDSGGLSLKPASAMEDMKIDMSGGATVLGIFDYLLKTSCTIPCIVYGILPACENMPSGKAMRPGDIVKTIDGTSIEVLNTDAEGRLTLADAIAYAERIYHPDIIIDFATLTGACMVALGTEIAGLFGNNPSLNKAFVEIANKEGDTVWELPLYKRYLERMKSRVADLKNIGGSPHYGGAISAALFIQEFVKKAKWIHLDIAGTAYNNSKPNGIIDVGGTGWGIQTIISLLRSL